MEMSHGHGMLASATCANHPSNVVSGFCVACSVFTCGLCTAHNAVHYLHDGISLDLLRQRERDLGSQLTSVERSIDKVKVSLKATRAILRCLKKTATSRIQELNKQLDQVVSLVQDIRNSCVTAILRDAQTELTAVVSCRERRRHAQLDRKRRVFRKHAELFLLRHVGKLREVMCMAENGGVTLQTLNVQVPVQPQSASSSALVALGGNLTALLKQVRTQANNLTESEAEKNVMLIGNNKVSFFNALKNQWCTGQPIGLKGWRYAAATWNGKVVVTGGKMYGRSGRVTDSVEQFDPAQNSWTAFPRLLTARRNHALVNLEGSLYAIGGYDRDDKLVRDAERYDAQAQCWQPAFALQTARAKLAAVTLRGCIFITGGIAVQSNPLASCETYRGRGQQIVYGASLKIGRLCHAAAAHVDTIYVFGGQWCNSGIAPVEQYDWHEEQWTLLSLTLGGMIKSFATCNNGNIYVFKLCSDSFDVFNEATKLSRSVQLPDSTNSVAVTSIKWVHQTSSPKACNQSNKSTKSLLVCAGGCNESGPIEEVSVYDPKCEVWRSITNSGLARLEAAAVTWNNLVVVAGGKTDSGTTNSVEVFDILSATWSSLAELRMPRQSHAIVNVNGTLFVFGGRNGRDQILQSVERYDANKRKWEPQRNFLEKRYFFGADSCEKGVVLSGGVGFDYICCELYDARRNCSNAIACLNISRYQHASATHDGAVYVFGGYSQTNGRCLAEIEQYDAVGNVWTLLNVRLTQAREDLAAACADDKIYILGGYREDFSNLVDVFDPSKVECKLVTTLPAAARDVNAAFVEFH